MAQRLLLVDSASQYFRAFYGVPASLRAPDGSPINAVRGFLNTLTRMVAESRATQLVLAWDEDWRPEFRTELVPSYKAHRVASDGDEEVPDELTPQVDVIRDLAAALGLAVVGLPGFEADDVIATVAARSPVPVVVLTGDRDLFQVIDDDRGVEVWYTGKGEPQVFTDVIVRDRYGIGAAQYADFALLRGDPSDGLPGVKGVGEKTAARLLAQYGDLTALERAAADGDGGLTPALRRALTDARDYISAARTVVRAHPDLPLPAFDATLHSAPADATALAELVGRTGLGTTVERWLKVAAQATGE